MLRIRVYSVNRATGERRTIRPELVLTGEDANPLDLTMALPPCRCPLHRERAELPCAEAADGS
ncbi:hypothetical protein [Streptomyces alkaliterrae]|uniref:Uncharacterized protein n=1 Tax=Streptomyces alkaliterrae TaxID=2213162 RepID=A0A5P0YUY9_9ACTN|nr:hypothetical protein [Streptomyces alkaliterrae]MBB1255651.1 hypothetical protein [Streptomyces alkaliterrae]MBB1261214.1 hypothetical protein [Streptomyces alkaliterrae]MQS04104.1 hypothetical protein [Streptomyces alkaliterrae]